MKTLDEFKTFYEEDLADAISDTEREIEETDLESVGEMGCSTRVKSFFQMWFYVSGGLFVVGALILVFMGGIAGIAMAFLLALLGGFIVSVLGQIIGVGVREQLLKTAQVETIVEKNIASKVVSFFGDDFSLDPDGQIDPATINPSLTLPSRAEVVRGGDYVQGIVGETDVAFSEVNLYTSEIASGQIGGVPEELKDEHREMREMMDMSADKEGFFRGLYFVADFHKHFRGHTIVRPTDGDADPDERLVTENGVSVERLEQVHLEDPELESLYNVYGTDQQQARYILSTSMMERVKDFRKRTGKTVSLAFYKSNMHVAVPYEHDLLEVYEAPSMKEFTAEVEGTKNLDLLENLVDREQVFSYFKDLRFILGIVEAFDLNKRIWLKEGAPGDDTEGAPEEVDTGGVSDNEEVDRERPGSTLSNSDDIVDDVFEDDSTESSSDGA